MTIKLVLIADAQKQLTNVYPDVSGGANNRNFGPSIHQHPLFVYASR